MSTDQLVPVKEVRDDPWESENMIDAVPLNLIPRPLATVSDSVSSLSYSSSSLNYSWTSESEIEVWSSNPQGLEVSDASH